MYQKHEQLASIKNNITLWKYMDFSKFVNLLTTKSVWFNRIDNFEDIYEATYPHANKELRKIYYDTAIPQSVYDDIELCAKKRLYVFCLHNSEFESAAMWNLYARESGICIKTNGKRLKAAFSPETKAIHITKINYIDYEKDFLPERNLFYLGTHKRKSFEHEKEVRCLYLGDNNSPVENGFNISIDLETLIEEIYISPYAPIYLKQTVEYLIKIFALNIPVIQSPLYKMT